MAGVCYEKGRSQWRVTWYRSPTDRTTRRFATEDEARAFVPTITDEVRRAPSARERVVPSRPRRRTAEQVLHFIADNFEIAENGCWIWTNTLTNEGYGRLTWKQDGHPKVSGAHRLVLHVGVEPVPSNMVTDHLCRNRACVNPDHLEVVTQRENVMRSPIAPGAVNAAKTHCPQGHEYTPENTYVYTLRTRSTTVRVCRTCQRAYAKRRYEARKLVKAA